MDRVSYDQSVAPELQSPVVQALEEVIATHLSCMAGPSPPTDLSYLQAINRTEQDTEWVDHALALQALHAPDILWTHPNSRVATNVLLECWEDVALGLRPPNDFLRSSSPRVDFDPPQRR